MSTTRSDSNSSERAKGVLTDRNFVKLFVGQTVSLVGTQITIFTMPLVAVLALRATVFQVGVLNALRLAPVVVVALFAGVWLDRTRRRPVLIVCALCSSLLIGLVPAGASDGFLSIWLLYGVAVLVGGLNVVFDIGILSYVPNLVEQDCLPEANGKLQASLAVAGIAGPAAAGFLVGVLTAPITLSLDAVSYLLVALGLITIRKSEPKPEIPQARASVRRQIAEGFHAVYGSKLLSALLTQTAVLNLSYGMFWTLFVVYAVRLLGLTPLKLGFVTGAGSVGALLGALLAVWLRNKLGLGRALAAATVGSSAPLLLVILPRNASLLAISTFMAAMLIYGFNVANLNVNGITIRQIITPKRLLARMNATYRMLLFGAPPAGSLLGGLLGSIMGLRPALLTALVTMTTPLLWLFFSPIFRLRDMPTGPDENLSARTT